MIFSATAAFDQIADLFVDDVDPVSAFSAFSDKIHENHILFKNKNNPLFCIAEFFVYL
jgi:glutamine phosphoribosylpyrophosphate amidotransferase